MGWYLHNPDIYGKSGYFLYVWQLNVVLRQNPQRKLSIFYFISIIFDLCSTYFSTPDLSREGAWDYKILNIGWLGLISLSFLYFIVTWVIFMYFNDKDRFPVNIKSKKVRIWISRFTWMMIINFTIAYFLAVSNFLYCFENVEINNSTFHYFKTRQYKSLFIQ